MIHVEELLLVKGSNGRVVETSRSGNKVSGLCAE